MNDDRKRIDSVKLTNELIHKKCYRDVCDSRIDVSPKKLRFIVLVSILQVLRDGYLWPKKTKQRIIRTSGYFFDKM